MDKIFHTYSSEGRIYFEQHSFLLVAESYNKKIITITKEKEHKHKTVISLFDTFLPNIGQR